MLVTVVTRLGLSWHFYMQVNAELRDLVKTERAVEDPLGSSTLITAVDKWHEYDRCFVGYVDFGYINTTRGRSKSALNGKPKFRK